MTTQPRGVQCPPYSPARYSSSMGPGCAFPVSLTTVSLGKDGDRPTGLCGFPAKEQAPLPRQTPTHTCACNGPLLAAGNSPDPDSILQRVSSCLGSADEIHSALCGSDAQLEEEEATRTGPCWGGSCGRAWRESDVKEQEMLPTSGMGCSSLWFFLESCMEPGQVSNCRMVEASGTLVSAFVRLLCREVKFLRLLWARAWRRAGSQGSRFPEPTLYP